MLLINRLKSKNIKVVEIPKWGTYLRQTWIDNFANHLSLDDKKDIYLFDWDGYCGYLWHLFSYGKRECLSGELADQAFAKVRKIDCYVFYQHTDYALILEGIVELNANDFLDESDVYVVDKEFNWTYVKTHETGWCGPYFCQK